MFWFSYNRLRIFLHLDHAYHKKNWFNCFCICTVGVYNGKMFKYSNRTSSVTRAFAQQVLLQICIFDLDAVSSAQLWSFLLNKFTNLYQTIKGWQQKKLYIGRKCMYFRCMHYRTMTSMNGRRQFQEFSKSHSFFSHTYCYIAQPQKKKKIHCHSF